MCNLYTYEMTAEDMRLLKEHYRLVGTDYLDILRGRNEPADVYPNRMAPVIRSVPGPDGPTYPTTMMRWGFPAPSFYQSKAPVTNVRKVASAYWKPYFKPEQRCLVPVTAFAEPDKNTAKPVVFRWFARPDGGPFFFAGIWREWVGDRGTKAAPNVGTHLLFSFLTTEPNGVVEPIHEKAMPVILDTPEKARQWLDAPAEEALQLQQPAPEDALVVVERKKASGR